MFMEWHFLILYPQPSSCDLKHICSRFSYTLENGSDLWNLLYWVIKLCFYHHINYFKSYMYRAKMLFYFFYFWKVEHQFQISLNAQFIFVAYKWQASKIRKRSVVLSTWKYIQAKNINYGGQMWTLNIKYTKIWQ